MSISPPGGGLAVRHLFALFFGTIVGVGWVTASGGWIAQAGAGGAVLAFAIGGGVMTLLGLAYAEMMAMLPAAYGAVGYVHFVYGDRAAFWAGWLLLLSYAATLGFFVVTVPWLVEVIAPSLVGPTLYALFGADVHAGPLGISMMCAVGLAAANHVGAAAAARLQLLIVGLKIALGVLLGFAAAMSGSSANLAPVFVGDALARTFAAVAGVAVTTPFWFAGFDVLPQAMRERSAGVRLAALGTLVVLTTFAAFLFYATVILGAAALLPRDTLLASPLPTFNAFLTGLGSPVLAKAVIIVACIGVLSSWNANLFAGARVLAAIGTARLAPAWIGATSARFATPARAIWAVSALGIALGMLGPAALVPLVAAASIALVATFAVICAGVLRLRRTHPDLARPYRVRGRWTLHLALVFAALLLCLSAVDPLSGATEVPLAWILLAGWAIGGEAYWRASAAQRGVVSAIERKAILAGISG